jgi:hypothetical protein
MVELKYPSPHLGTWHLAASLPGPLPLQLGVSMPASHASGGPNGSAGLNSVFT